MGLLQENREIIFDGHSIVIQWSFDGHSIVIQWSFNGTCKAQVGFAGLAFSSGSHCPYRSEKAVRQQLMTAR